ncbi:hypothetical protein FUAX_48050 (plasmid) [Fulvitalea axinellae]|uniref:Sulfur carrier protein ThiS n=1 Tax=Fulvitalea axinellae TaxID=1182444 RepID=A0AAU9CQ76_9BACT|nr:hypothetical protein FUAX_48050 [Fulvitalea axinellae]
MRIHVNNKAREVKDEKNVHDLLEELEVPKQGTAVAINNRVVPKDAWLSTLLAEDDKVTLIRATQGG